MKNSWDEIRAAYHVARLGTLSAAAVHLGVHHATVIRQIDALEARLGCKLFQRHSRGYSATEAGQDLLTVAAVTEDQLRQLESRLRGKGAEISGELIVTMLSGFSPWLTPILARFQDMNPDLRLLLLLDERLLRLEYGEAHLAIRAGPQPQEPDNVVKLLGRFAVTLYAHKSYIARHGTMNSAGDIVGHKFVSGIRGVGRSPLDQWLRDNLPPEAIVFRASEARSQRDAIKAGIGIGFMASNVAQADPDLVQMLAPLPNWQMPVWLVTHMDLHRTAKVQAVTRFLMDQVGEKGA